VSQVIAFMFTTCQVCAMDPRIPVEVSGSSPSVIESAAGQDVEIATTASEVPRKEDTPFREVPNEPSNPVASTSGSRAAEERDSLRWTSENDELADAFVWIHVYHIDSYTGWLNGVWLKAAEMPICHVGIEVYGEEWAFNYFDDCWDDPAISGVVNCLPRNMPGYDYQESVNLGATKLAPHEVDELLWRLRDEWPACTYHLTRHNCISFAQHLVGLLKPPQPFPPPIAGVNDASRNNPIHEGVIDYGWQWAKWWMRKQTADEQAAREAAAAEARKAATNQAATSVAN